MRVYGFSQEPEWVLAEILDGGEISKKHKMGVAEECVPGILADVIAGVRELHLMNFCHGDILAALDDMNVMLKLRSDSKCPTAKLIDLDAVDADLATRKEDFRQLFDALEIIITTNSDKSWAHKNWAELRKWKNLYKNKAEQFAGVLEDLTADAHGFNKSVRMLNKMEEAMR